MQVFPTVPSPTTTHFIGLPELMIYYLKEKINVINTIIYFIVITYINTILLYLYIMNNIFELYSILFILFIMYKF